MEHQKTDNPQANEPGPDSEPLQDLDVWRDALLKVIADELVSVRTVVSQISKDVQSGLANIKIELANWLTVQTQTLHSRLQNDIASILDDKFKEINFMETKLELIGADLGNRISRLEASKPSQSTPPSEAVTCPRDFQTDSSMLLSLLEVSPSWITSEYEAELQLSPPAQLNPEERDRQKCATSIADLEPQLAKAIQEHVPKVHNSNEKLSALQFGFFSYKFQEMKITNTKDLDKKAKEILQAGIEKHIWTNNWQPQGNPSLLMYLREKIKTMVKKRKSLQIIEQLHVHLDKKRKEGDPPQEHWFNV